MPTSPDRNIATRCEAVHTVRVAIMELAKALPEPDEVREALPRLIAERRGEAFSNLLLAALHAGIPLDASLLVDGGALLPDVRILAAVAGHLEGEVGPALLAAVDGRRLGWEGESVALFLAAAWAKRHGAPLPDGLVRHARALARTCATELDQLTMLAVQGLVDDESLALLLPDPSVPATRRAIRSVAEDLVADFLGPVLDAVPEKVQSEVVPQWAPVRRAVPKIGRNELCPCGSGKKYKHCCEAKDRARLADSSDVAGLTRQELYLHPEPNLTPERIQDLRGYELARMDFAAVPEPARPAVLQQLLALHEHAAAVRLFRELGVFDRDRLLDAIEIVSGAGDVAHARELIALGDDVEAELTAAARFLVTSDRIEAFHGLERDARATLDEPPVDVAYALLESEFPALGVLVARGVLPLATHLDAWTLNDVIEEARDQLDAPPFDPIGPVFDQLAEVEEPAEQEELADLRGRLDSTERDLAHTEAALARAEAEITARRQRERDRPQQEVVTPAEVPAVQAPDPEVQALRARTKQLKEDLKSRHRERNDLRRELADAHRRIAQLEATEPETPDEEEEEEPVSEVDFDAVVGAVRLPLFSDTVREHLRTVPPATARAALVRAGELAAGRPHAFHEARPLQNPADVWRVRVGRSYRMLFHLRDDEIELLALIHRQDLEGWIHRLR